MSNRLPRITIITPSYNQGQYIEQTIDSVLSQNYPNLEYIIMDGGSKDNTPQIIKKYEQYLAYWVSAPDKGQSDAINQGRTRMTGEVFNWLNSDDYYMPNALHIIGETFAANPQALVVGGKGRVFQDGGDTSHYNPGTDVYEGNLPKTIGWARIDQPETFWRREAIDRIGILDARLHYLMDRDWWIKFLLYFGLHRVVRIQDVVVNFRLHQNSKTVQLANLFEIERDTYFHDLARQANLPHVAEAIAQHLHIKPDFVIENPAPIPAEIAERVFAYYFLLLADECYARGEATKARQMLQHSHINLLASAEQALHRKLALRLRFVPAALLKWWRGK